MNCIFFSQIDTDAKYQGAVAKVFDEIKAFENRGISVRHVNVPHVAKGLRSTHIGKAMCASMPFTFIFSKYTYDPSYDGYDVYYFRFEAADRYLIHLLRKLRENNPKSKIIIELPNYPGNAWMVMPWCFMILLKDILARNKYKKYIDRFVVLDPSYREIYGVPTIVYMNGIDTARIRVRGVPQKDDPGRIDIVGVATMYPSHGYERLIESLNSYYSGGGSRNVVFHVVGEGPGPELPKYKELVERYGLNDHVAFEGTLVGEELASCYDKCDLALDDLCGFRIGMEVSSSLKSREYLAYGLPIIAGCDIDILQNRLFRYLLKLDNDDSLIDLNTIIAFYDDIYAGGSYERVIREIRKFAEENCSYEATLGNVFSYISYTDAVRRSGC